MSKDEREHAKESTELASFLSLLASQAESAEAIGVLKTNEIGKVLIDNLDSREPAEEATRRGRIEDDEPARLAPPTASYRWTYALTFLTAATLLFKGWHAKKIRQQEDAVAAGKALLLESLATMDHRSAIDYSSMSPKDVDAMLASLREEKISDGQASLLRSYRRDCTTLDHSRKWQSRATVAQWLFGGGALLAGLRTRYLNRQQA